MNTIKVDPNKVIRTKPKMIRENFLSIDPNILAIILGMVLLSMVLLR